MQCTLIHTETALAGGGGGGSAGLPRDRAGAAAHGGSDGLWCTHGDLAGTTRTFSLTTRTGYILTPDGNSVYMWGLSSGADPFQHPSPVLCVNEGETITIIVNNTLREDISLIFPGRMVSWQRRAGPAAVRRGRRADLVD